MTYDPSKDAKKTLPREEEYMDEDMTDNFAGTPMMAAPRPQGAMDEGDGLPPEMWLQRLSGEVEQLLRESQERHSMYEQREQAIKKELAQVRQHRARTEGEIEMLFNMRAINQDQQQFLARRTQ